MIVEWTDCSEIHARLQWGSEVHVYVHVINEVEKDKAKQQHKIPGQLGFKPTMSALPLMQLSWLHLNLKNG